MDAPASFEFAKELTTQLITLSTAVIGVTITFTKDISSGATGGTRRWLYGSWLFFLASVVCGIWTLGAITGTLARVSPIKPDSLYVSNITTPSMCQAILF